MNYDFTKSELALFADVKNSMANTKEEGHLERRDLSKNESAIRRALTNLAQTPYLKLAISPIAGLNGQLSLMGAMEILSTESPSVYLSIEAGTRPFSRAVSQWGSAVQKDKWLTPFLDGKLIGALALSDTDLNIENDPLATEGILQNGSVVINGAKSHVINAPIADWISVAGLCEGKNALFVVEKTDSGLRVDPPCETMGYTGTPTASITLENCRIPVGQVIFPPKTVDMIGHLKLWNNQALLGASLGLSNTAFTTACDYAKSHKSGGKPIIAYQAIGFKLAEMLTLYKTSQLMAFRSAWALDEAPDDVADLTLCAKVFCAESAERICSEALQVLGNAGYFAKNSVENAYRCTKYGQVAGTSTEIARVKIGDAALGYRK